MNGTVIWSPKDVTLYGTPRDDAFEDGLERGIGHGKRYIGTTDQVAMSLNRAEEFLYGFEKKDLKGHSKDDTFQDGLNRGIGHGKRYIGTSRQDNLFGPGCELKKSEARLGNGAGEVRKQQDMSFQEGIERGIGHGRRYIGAMDHISGRRPSRCEVQADTSVDEQQLESRRFVDTTPTIATITSPIPYQSIRRDGVDATGGANVRAPLSARERKQVFMQSSLFDVGGPSPQSIYTRSRQSAELTNVVTSRHTPRERKDLYVPAPADFKATVNAGHGVVIPSGSPSCGPPAKGRVNGREALDSGFVQFNGDSERVAVVRSSGEDGNIPKEYWATKSTLDWTDTRSELTGLRGQEMRAEARKMRELSSEILGSARRVEASEKKAKLVQDIRSVQSLFVSYTDTRLDKASRCANLEERLDPEASAPLSARASHLKNLETSFANEEFPRQSQSESPLRSWRGTAFAAGAKDRNRLTAGGAEKEMGGTDENRRQTERNFSDLFGTNCGARQHIKSRAEVMGTANCSFLDSNVETAKRNLERWQTSPRSSLEALASSEVLSTMMSPRMAELSSRPQIVTAEEFKNTRQERACWDTRDMFSACSEIARRSRDRERVENGRLDTQRSTSASERKRLGLVSSQLKVGMGANARPWDDGRAGPGPPSPKPSMAIRSCPSSPAGRSFRNIRPDSARDRKLGSLMSSGVF